MAELMIQYMILKLEKTVRVQRQAIQLLGGKLILVTCILYLILLQLVTLLQDVSIIFLFISMN